ncbi:hypothetical protein HZA56_02960 [Candidatus Poribacteria bacterium]|nr:hypothetical protein [Candidatus Poribacteria bacterium]
MTPTDKVEELREELRNITVAYGRGDIPKKKFERLQVEKSVDLYRAIVGAQLEEKEEILAEHHVVRAHMKLNESVLKEPEQAAISLFLTGRRLLRLRSVIEAGQAVRGDTSDRTVIDEVQIRDVINTRLKRELRLGEAITGAVICIIAFLFRSWLLVTGTLLVILGAMGILHGLLMPTKWIELDIHGGFSSEDDIIRVYGLRKKSARKLLKMLRERMARSS